MTTEFKQGLSLPSSTQFLVMLDKTMLLQSSTTLFPFVSSQKRKRNENAKRETV